MDIMFAIFLSFLLLIITIFILLRLNRSRQTDLHQDSTQNERSHPTISETLQESSSFQLNENVGSFQPPMSQPVQLEEIQQEQASAAEDYQSPLLVGSELVQGEGSTTDVDVQELEEARHPQGGTRETTSEGHNESEAADGKLISATDLESWHQEVEGDKESMTVLGEIESLTAPGDSGAATNSKIWEDVEEDVDPVLWKIEWKREPSKYKPPVLTLPRSKSISQERTSKKSSDSNKRTFPLLIRALFQRGGFIQVSLLLGRQLELPEELETVFGKQNITLVALMDDWFQDIVPQELGQLLEEGIEWDAVVGEGQLVRWSLSGRQIYVLAPSNSLSGFISTTRLVLNEEHIVLCTRDILQSVRNVISETGSPIPEEFDSDLGVPEGWVCLRNVVPNTPIPQTENQDILNILRPLADVEIVLNGGVRIENSVWLAHYPPKIRLHGDLSIVDRVVIDGKEAAYTENSGYTVLGSDQSGVHNIWAAGQNKSYTIQDLISDWNIWETNLFPGKRLAQNKISICGPLVVNEANAAKNSYPSIVPATNPVLVGDVPGQILKLNSGAGKESLVYGDSPLFQPVWALPADPYRADKSTIGILLMGDMLPPRNVQNFLQLSLSEKESVWEWSKVILAANRKGLKVIQTSPAINNLWKMYKKQAKAIWKELK